MDKEISGISFGGVIYSLVRSDEEYKVKAGETFTKEMVNPLKTINGTIGDMHRKHLHEKLDEWIDNALTKAGENNE
jgi:hypothetical protein